MRQQFRTKTTKLYRKNKKCINLLFGITYTLLILLLFGREGISCQGLDNLINEVIIKYSYCEQDSDCTVYAPLTSDCEMPGACAMSLNTPLKPYYLNYIILNHKMSYCVQDCTSVCVPYTELTPKCEGNTCDFTLT